MATFFNNQYFISNNIQYHSNIIVSEKEMIILGEQHSFSKLELESLKSIFSSITFIKNINIDRVIEETRTKLKNSKIKLIVLNTQATVPAKLLTFLTEEEQKGVNYISVQHFMEKYLKKTFISPTFDNIDFLENIKPYSRFKYFIKRIIDFGVSIPLAIFSIPFMFYSVYKIKKESPDGPIFFKQQRVGKNGKEFTCYKFRSMRTDVKFFNHYTQEDDPRIFPWGNIMRKTRIDELPQLWNVLKGDLHLIGPRTEWGELVEKYEANIPYYQKRHIIAPGITGWAQVNYPYGENEYDTHQKLMYDLYYISNWSLWLELKTVIKTVLVVLGRKGL